MALASERSHAKTLQILKRRFHFAPLTEQITQVEIL